MSVAERMKELTRKISEQSENLKGVEQFIRLLTEAPRIFVVGAGRSGLVGRAFAMRLMHLGFTVYVVGETTTPAVKKRDLLVVISGSGETSSVASIARTAKGRGMRIALLTSRPKSTIGKLADVIIEIKGRVKTKKGRNYFARQISGEHEPTTPLGTLFEVTSMVFLDSVIGEIMEKQHKKERHLRKFHTELE